MTSKYINGKSLSRLAVIQSLYLIMYREVSGSIAQSEIVEYYKDKEQLFRDGIIDREVEYSLNKEYYDKLLSLVTSHQVEIEALLDDLGVKKDNSIPLLLKIILQVGIAELQFCQTPRKVVINEYTTIVAEFFSSRNVSFINAILDKVNSKD